MKSYVFRVELEYDEEVGVWSAVLPAIPGCAVDEESPQAALEALQDAAETFVEYMLEQGQEVPIEAVASGTGQAVLAVNVGVRTLAT